MSSYTDVAATATPAMYTPPPPPASSSSLSISLRSSSSNASSLSDFGAAAAATDHYQQQPGASSYPDSTSIIDHHQYDVATTRSNVNTMDAAAGSCLLPPLDPTIEAQPWYFYDVTREQVTRLMMGKPDGTFLVRDSTSRGMPHAASNNSSVALDAYTLTLRNGGTNKLIKIYYSNDAANNNQQKKNGGGRFGFAEPYEFTTVRDLIEHYYTTSLARYNRTLDVCLKYALSRRSEFDTKTTEDAIELLKTINVDYIVTSDMYDKCYEEHEQLKQQLQVKRQALDAFDHTIQMYEDQLNIARNVSKSMQLNNNNNIPASTAAPGAVTPGNTGSTADASSTAAALKRNEEILLRKISGMRQSKQQTLDTVRLEQTQQHNKAMHMRTMEPKIMRLYKQREDLSKVLHTLRGLHIDVINMHLQESSRQAQIETAKKFGTNNATPPDDTSATTPDVAEHQHHQQQHHQQTQFDAKDPYHQYEYSLQYQQTPPTPPPQYHQQPIQYGSPDAYVDANGVQPPQYQQHQQQPVAAGGVSRSRTVTNTANPAGSYSVEPPPYAEHQHHHHHHHQSLQQQQQQHANADNWYLGAQCTRQQAQVLLGGKPCGTFLIRKRTGEPLEGTHALSIVDQSGVQIHHAIIYENPSAGTFGFVPTTSNNSAAASSTTTTAASSSADIKFNSLKDLVLFYADRSLEEHNPALKVAMLHPAMCTTPSPPPPMYQQAHQRQTSNSSQQHQHQPLGGVSPTAAQTALLSWPPVTAAAATQQQQQPAGATAAGVGVGGGAATYSTVSHQHRPYIQRQQQQHQPPPPPPPLSPPSIAVDHTRRYSNVFAANLAASNITEKSAAVNYNSAGFVAAARDTAPPPPLHHADNDPFLFFDETEHEYNNDAAATAYDEAAGVVDRQLVAGKDADSSYYNADAGVDVKAETMGVTGSRPPSRRTAAAQQPQRDLVKLASAGVGDDAKHQSRSDSPAAGGGGFNLSSLSSSSSSSSSNSSEAAAEAVPLTMAASGDGATAGAAVLGNSKTTTSTLGLISGGDKIMSTSPSPSSGSASLLSSSLSSTSTITSSSATKNASGGQQRNK